MSPDEHYTISKDILQENLRVNYITINRKLLKWGWYKTPHMVPVWLYLLLSANWQRSKWQNEVIERGQVVIGRHSIQRDTGISEQSIRTCLERLKSTNEITIKSTNKYSIVTIQNYSKYQISVDTNQPANQPANQPTTNQQLTNNQPTTNHIQELKNIKNERIEEALLPVSTDNPSKKAKRVPTDPRAIPESYPDTDSLVKLSLQEVLLLKKRFRDKGHFDYLIRNAESYMASGEAKSEYINRASHYRTIINYHEGRIQRKYTWDSNHHNGPNYYKD